MGGLHYCYFYENFRMLLKTTGTGDIIKTERRRLLSFAPWRKRIRLSGKNCRRGHQNYQGGLIY